MKLKTPLFLVGKKHPSLKTVSADVQEPASVHEAAAQMYKIMKNNRGVGLAANQVGLNIRLIVVEYASTSITMINPVITKSPGKIVTSIKEGCLSYPNKFVDRKRSKRITVEGFNLDWEPVKIDARNMLAFIFQHEIDHLNGITIGNTP